MSRKPIPSQEVLRDFFEYNGETGDLIWRARPREYFANSRACSVWNARYSGSVSGSMGPIGYRQLALNNDTFLAHRVVWKFHHGYCPEFIDHVNGIRNDNRIENLRPATHQENSRNSKIRADNSSGIVGVVWDKRDQRWVARIVISGRNLALGSFVDIDAAAAARQSAEIKFFAEFRRSAT